MEPHVPQKAPYAVEVEAGKSYFWCSCGQSSKQPFCDGSHKGSGFSPVKWEAPENKTVFQWHVAGRMDTSVYLKINNLDFSMCRPIDREIWTL